MTALVAPEDGSKRALSAFVQPIVVASGEMCALVPRMICGAFGKPH